MDNVYKTFYRGFYIKTGGFIPASQLEYNIFPGDFFQIRNGEMVLLGNIFKNNVIDKENVVFEYGIKLNATQWSFSDGLTKPYTGRASGHDAAEGEFEFSRQVLAFAARGSYVFKATEPESVKISNWNDIQQQLIIRLTQTIYSFREVYVVTESVTASDWALIVSDADHGELEIATELEHVGIADIFGDASSKTMQSKDIACYRREVKRKPSFFKAKKLMVQDERVAVLIDGLINQLNDINEWAADFYNNSFDLDDNNSVPAPQQVQGSVLDMLQANQLNPSSALLYFRWADANLDDIERFFLSDR
jgi:hypothetical protein